MSSLHAIIPLPMAVILGTVTKCVQPAHVVQTGPPHITRVLECLLHDCRLHCTEGCVGCCIRLARFRRNN